MTAWRPGAPVRLETARFELASMTRWEAARHSYPWALDPEVMLPFGVPAKAWTRLGWYKWHKAYNNRKKFCFAIRPKGTPAVIGYESCEISSQKNAYLTVIIGDRSWWGKGVVVECRREIIRFLFETVGCRRVWGTPSARNLPSVFNYQALGFKSEGILRQHGIDARTLHPVDHLVFGLLREEWPRTRERTGS